MVLVSLSACDDYVDIEPKGKFIPTTFKDYQLLMNNGYTLFGAGLSSGGLIGTIGNTLMATDDYYVSDEQIYNVSSGFSKDAYSEVNANIYTYENHVYNPEQEDLDWAQLYWVIAQANIVLDGIKDIDHPNQEEYNQLKGEALVHRADAYLSLINLYAKHYNAETASTDLGVPVLIEFDLYSSLERKSVAEVYQLVLDDLTAAKDLLQEETEVSARPSSPAALALLARTYLYMADYEKALSFAEECLKLRSTLNKYSDLPTSNLSSVNSWVSENYINDPEVILFKKSIQPQGYLIFTDYNFATRMILSKDLENRFETGDMRLENLCVDAYEIEGYKEMKSLYQLAVNYGPTVQEILLIKAECLARNNEPGLAMDAVNIIREHRFASDTTNPAYYELSASTGEEALTKVLEERRRELAFRGKRLFDIKRLNLDDATPSIELTRTALNKNIHIKANDDMWVFPIPRKNISLNPEIEQNPRGL